MSTERTFRWSMLMPSDRWVSTFQSTWARSTAVRGRYTQRSSQPSSMAMLGPKRKGAAPNMPALTTRTTTALRESSSPSALIEHSNNGAVTASGNHQLEVVTGECRADGFDVRTGSSGKDDSIPAEVFRLREQLLPECRPGAGQCRVYHEQDSATRAQGR